MLYCEPLIIVVAKSLASDKVEAVDLVLELLDDFAGAMAKAPKPVLSLSPQASDGYSDFHPWSQILAMVSNLLDMASILLVMALIRLAVASILIAMASFAKSQI